MTPTDILYMSPTDLVRFPELAALVGVQQDPGHHPEGCAWVHTMHCLAAFHTAKTGNVYEDTVVGLAALLHDTGKATTTQLRDGRWIAHGHESAGEAPTRAFLGRLAADPMLIEHVVQLVVTYMRPTFLYKEAIKQEPPKPMSRSVRRLAREVSLTRLARLVWIDKAGRPPKPQVSPEAEWLLMRAAELSLL